MKVMKALLLGGFWLTVSTVTVYAHDPSKHTDSSERPDCGAMEGMDHAHMDMADPVVQAMMKKCMGEMPADSHGQDHAPEDKAAQPPEQQEGHAGAGEHKH